MNFFKLRIDNLTRETADALSFEFKLEPDHPLKKFIPGQYISLKYHLKGQDFIRCYSLNSLPTDEILSFTVKKTKQGFISKELVKHSTVGMELEIAEPHGKFKVSPYLSKRRSHYFFAAGSGITPIISMIHQLLEEEVSSNIYLLYSNKKEEEIIFQKKLQELELKYSGQLKVCYTLSKKEKFLNLISRKQKDWKGWKGRVDKTMIVKMLDEANDPNKIKEFYICGPGPFIQTVEKSLHELQFDSKNIHKEYFSIQVDHLHPTNVSEESFPTCQLDFQLNGKKYQLEIKSGEKILDSLIRQGFDPPYSCSSGACATCIAKLINGKVKMDSDLALDKSEIDEGWILTCQARCLTDHAEIQY